MSNAVLFSNMFLLPTLDTHRLFHIMFIILSTKFSNEFPFCRNSKHSYSHVMTFIRSFYFHFSSSNQGTTFHTNKTKSKTGALYYVSL